MTVLHFYLPVLQFSNQTDIREKIDKLRCTGDIEISAVEYCFNVQISEEISVSNLQKLKWILSDPISEDGIVRHTTTFQRNPTNELLIEIGPRLNFSTPFSSNAVSVSHSIGLTSVKRIEKSCRYLVRLGCKSGEKTINQLKLKPYHVVTMHPEPDLPIPQIPADYYPLLEAEDNSVLHLPKILSTLPDILHDRMTECAYENPISSFDHGMKPEPWYLVDILNEGAKALEKINSDLGLSFDKWDIEFYTALFRKLGRNPTSVECFDLAQSNSEHSRHWFFKGNLKIDGALMPSSLFAMIMETPKYSNQNNVIRFSDNSSAIRGFTVKKIQPENPTRPSKFEFPDAHLHLTFTAETHNFPTAVSPFSGATTGTGGRIRDVQAVGRGGHTIAGTVGYSVGNLFVPGYHLDWEVNKAANLSTFAQPLEILIQASNGCSDYGNKFGEPVVCGFTRSFGLTDSQNHRVEYVKPILFSGGIGTLQDQFIAKQKPAKGMKVVKIGGPVYRIGVGGGSASSTEVQGDNKVELDFNAVQRGDAEMEQKLNRLVRGCLEYPGHENPILSIHDQGAGGNGNVLKELVEPEGAVIFTRAFELGDDSISTLDLWGAEYQESNAILCHEKDIPKLEALSRRERCPVNVVGTVTKTGKVILTEEEINHQKFLDSDCTDKLYPVNLDLEAVLGNVPKKEFNLVSSPIIHHTFYLPTRPKIMDMLRLVLRHPTVCSKRFLTNKVDRSVSGLIAQQQCVGPLHTPVADVAITAISHFDVCGIASSIGEQPIKGLVNPAAGARMSVAEALSNLVFAKISSLKDVKCSGNWMWPAKLPGEGVHLYNACAAMCSIMKELGIAVDGGKDSLSMATRLSNKEIVKSPGTLVISTYAPCPDITKKVTPDLKVPWHHRQGCLLYVDTSDGKSRLAGSILAQCYGQLGHNVPDIEDPGKLRTAFCITQQLIEAKKIVSGHDVSDGGLITCLIEMAISGVAGIRVNLTNTSENKTASEVLFSEECAWVVECEETDLDDILNLFKSSGVSCTLIGHSDSCGGEAKIDICYGGEQIFCVPLRELSILWEETSYQIEKLQMNPDCAAQESQSLMERTKPSYQYKFTPCPEQPIANAEIRVAVLREEGINGDREMAAALFMAGFEVWDVTMQDLLDEKISLDRFRGVIFPGGFSYADVFGAAKGWAATILYHENLRNQFNSFYQREDTFSFGVCNGCQLMCLINWIGNGVAKEGNLSPHVMLKGNTSNRFESRFSTVMIYRSPAVMLKNMENCSLGVWVAHGEGRFTYASDDIREYLEKNNCIAIRYVDDNNNATERYPYNPNGSKGGVAGICSQNGRHLAMMPHPERCVKFWQWPYIPPAWKKKVNGSAPNSFSPWFQLFLNAYNWCLDTLEN